MGSLNKDRLIYDPADVAESDQFGSFIKAGTDGDAISSTLVSGKEGLDVNVINAALVVSATDLDIRNLVFATDKVDVSGSEVSLNSATLAALENITVSATDLDIRDLTHVSDSIKIGDGTDFLLVNADGSINVNLTADDVADDAVDAGNPLKVGSRAFFGALAAISASGDRADLLSDRYRRIFTNGSPQVAASAAAFVVGNVTEVALSALQGRMYLYIQNLSSNDIYIGPTGVTTVTGMRVAKGSTLSLEIGDAVALFAIASSGLTNDVRVMQLA